MSVPSVSDLFLNVWVSRINSESFPVPGDEGWDRVKMNKYWGKVWMDCKELVTFLQSCEDLSTQSTQIGRSQESHDLPEPFLVDEIG